MTTTNEHLRREFIVDMKKYKQDGYCWGPMPEPNPMLQDDPLPLSFFQHGTISYISKPTLALKAQIKKLNELKNLLSQHFNANSSLLHSVDNMIHLATRYYHGTKDLPFDFVHRRFLPPDKRGWKLSYPGLKDCIRNQTLLPAPDVLYVESDDEGEECDTVKAHPECPSHSEGQYVVELYYSVCLESLCATLHDIFTEKHTRLRSIIPETWDFDSENIAQAEIHYLEQLHRESIAAIAQSLPSHPTRLVPHSYLQRNGV